MSFKKLRSFFRLSKLYISDAYARLDLFIYKTKVNLNKIISHVYDVIAYFILRRINLNKVDTNGETALHRAMDGPFDDDFKTIVRLIKCGADINAVDKNGDTILHKAACGYYWHREMLAFLLEHGANVNTVNKDGYTPLYLAVLAYHHEYLILRSSFYKTLALFIENGADINVADRNGDTALHTLVRLNKLKKVALLLRYGADVNTVNKEGVTPLFSAIKEYKSNPEMVALLLKHGADVNAVDKDSDTPLLHAVKEYEPNSEIVASLLKYGADVNAVDKKGVTPLFRAVKEYEPNSEIVALLLRHGADVNTVNKYGNTPLEYAVSKHGIRWNMTLSIVRVLTIATLLDNINAKKPYGIDRKQSILTLWSDCKEVIEALSKVTVSIKSLGNISLLNPYQEKDENKLMLMSQNEKLKKILENLNFKGNYSYLGEKIQAQLQKGLARKQALSTACNSIFTFNANRELNEDCWKDILKNLAQEDLKNVTRVASFFFKKSPSNDSYLMPNENHRRDHNQP